MNVVLVAWQQPIHHHTRGQCRHISDVTETVSRVTGELGDLDKKVVWSGVDEWASGVPFVEGGGG